MDTLVIGGLDLYLLLANKHIFLHSDQPVTFPCRTCYWLIGSRDK